MYMNSLFLPDFHVGYVRVHFGLIFNEIVKIPEVMFYFPLI